MIHSNLSGQQVGRMRAAQRFKTSGQYMRRIPPTKRRNPTIITEIMIHPRLLFA
jgi:hypothetical protein